MEIQNKPTVGRVGLIPAGGQASRIAPLPCSKEIFPVGFGPYSSPSRTRPKPVAQYLLDCLQVAGVDRVFFILRPGKWDIPGYFGDGVSRGAMPIGYLIVNRPDGVPFTVDSAYSFIDDRCVLFGFPDIIFEPKDAFVRLLERQSSTHADLVLGLFPAVNPQTMDMVEFDDLGKVRSIQVKPEQTKLTHTWILAVWTHAFTSFLHDAVSNDSVQEIGGQTKRKPSPIKELFLGDVFRQALHAGLAVDHVIFDEGWYIDIGTPDMLRRAVRHHSREAHAGSPDKP